jgi:hypothetical protein
MTGVRLTFSFSGDALRRSLRAVVTPLATLTAPRRAELGGDECRIAAICERFAKERFIGTANAIQFCHIEMFDAQGYCFVQTIASNSLLHRWTVKL